MTTPHLPSARRPLLGLNAYQWTVLLAAWLGWGFDVFDGLLFNFVAPNCIPTLLHLKIGSPEAKLAVPRWTGLLTSVLLLSWAVGGVAFGAVADRIGRAKTLLLTMLLYAVGTACCALAPNLWVLGLCRVIAGLGIGGEWAAGASMVAEVVPEERRVEAGAVLYTSAPIFLFLATFVNHLIAGQWLAADPELSWRYVFASGLVAAAVAFVVRASLKEPERWTRAARGTAAKLSELFAPAIRKRTLSGLSMAIVVLITWWSCNAFISVLATALARERAVRDALAPLATQQLIESWKALANNSFNWGGLLGTLLTIPAAKLLGRRWTFVLYFLFSAAALFGTFGVGLDPVTRLRCYFLIGVSVFGIFGSFTYYLPELFPTRLRATGSGFCYNIGRVVAAAGPTLVGEIGRQGTPVILHALWSLGWVPVVGLFLAPWIVETKGQRLLE